MVGEREKRKNNSKRLKVASQELYWFLIAIIEHKPNSHNDFE